MKSLEERILKEGIVSNTGILKVGAFLNHMVDVKLLQEMADEIVANYKDKGVTKILTLETSGIPLALMVAVKLSIPLVYAKKTGSFNLEGDVYDAFVHSFTKRVEYRVMVVKDYIDSSDAVLIVDDFLAEGSSTCGLIDLVDQAEAEIVGVAVAIEKTFQNGGKYLRESGVDVLSLAKVKKIDKDLIEFE